MVDDVKEEVIPMDEDNPPSSLSPQPVDPLQDPLQPAQPLDVHSVEKPFACSEAGCEKAFARKDHLNAHKRIHSGEKPFTCSEPGCDWAFIQKSNLIYHNRTHSAEKPFKSSESGIWM